MKKIHGDVIDSYLYLGVRAIGETSVAHPKPVWDVQGAAVVPEGRSQPASGSEGRAYPNAEGKVYHALLVLCFRRYLCPRRVGSCQLGEHKRGCQLHVLPPWRVRGLTPSPLGCRILGGRMPGWDRINGEKKNIERAGVTPAPDSNASALGT